MWMQNISVHYVVNLFFWRFAVIFLPDFISNCVYTVNLENDCICKRISMRLHIMAVRKPEERMPANLLHCMPGKSYITHSGLSGLQSVSSAFPYRFLWERFVYYIEKCLLIETSSLVTRAIVYDLFSDRSVFIPVQRLQYFLCVNESWLSGKKLCWQEPTKLGYTICLRWLYDVDES